VFAETGIKQLEQKYDIRVCNLSHLPYRAIEFPYKGRQLSVPLPVLLLDESDLLLTIPVPKVHMNTQVSLAVKNQWGCIPEPSMRLRLHPFLEKVVYEVNKHVRATFAVVDGKYGLNRSGPMRGDVVELDWLMVADNIYAADAACCQLMQIDPRRVYYLRHLAAAEKVLPDVAGIQFNREWRPFVKERFYLRRAWTDYPGLWAFRSPLLTYWGYYSPLASLLHQLLYLFREPFYDYAGTGRQSHKQSVSGDARLNRHPDEETAGGTTAAKETVVSEKPIRV
jgi:hypothetical protein